MEMKRLLAFMLIMCLCFTLVACGGSVSTADDTANNSGDSVTTSNDKEPVKKEKISVMVYDRNNIPPEEGTLEDNRWTKWIRENAPQDIEIEYVPIPRNASRDKLNALFASGSAPDLILEFDATIRNDLVSQGLVMPLDELIVQKSTYYKGLIEKYPDLAKLSTKEDGKNYMVGRITGLGLNHSMLIRNDWLKELNLKVPTTPEELLAVSKAFSEQDPDGNGKKDTYGIAMSGTSTNIYLYAFQAVYPVLDNNNQYINTWEQMRDATAFKKQLFEAGVVDKDFLTDTTGKKAEQDFLSGKTGIWNGGFGYEKYEALKKAVPEAELIPIALPRTQYGQFSPELGNPMSPIGLINKNAKHPDAVMKYIDFMCNPETAHTLYWGIEGEHWKKGSNGMPQFIDPDKNKKQLSWNRDYGILSSGYFDPGILAKKEDMTQLEQEYDAIFEAAKQMYINESAPMPNSVDFNTTPTLPQGLLIIKQSAESSINDIWVKAIVTPNYSAADAMKDAQNVWNKSGGQKVDEFITKWFTDNEENLVYTNNYYQFK
jgi:putative aldouronate transport system substrate-binding protein